MRLLWAGLTPPSSGHTTARHIGTRCQGRRRRCVPLMSNVSRPSHALREVLGSGCALRLLRSLDALWKQRSFAPSCCASKYLPHRLRPAARPLAVSESPNFSSIEVSRLVRLAPAAHTVPMNSINGGFLGARCRLAWHESGVTQRGVARPIAPNPFIERTAKSRLRLLSSSAHVER